MIGVRFRCRLFQLPLILTTYIYIDRRNRLFYGFSCFDSIVLKLIIIVQSSSYTKNSTSHCFLKKFLSALAMWSKIDTLLFCFILFSKLSNSFFNSPAPYTFGCVSRICSIKEVPDLGIPTIKMGVRSNASVTSED